MSTVSNGSLESLDQRVYLEKATDRVTDMLCPNPAIYYTHNPAILFWAFTSSRISNNIKLHVVSFLFVYFRVLFLVPFSLLKTKIQVILY